MESRINEIRKNDVKRFGGELSDMWVGIDEMLVSMMDGVGREVKVWESEEFKKEFEMLEKRVIWLRRIVDKGEVGMRELYEEWNK